MSLVSEAGSRRASAFEAVSVCPLVTSVKSQAAAATDGAGTPAGADGGEAEGLCAATTAATSQAAARAVYL